MAFLLEDLLELLVLEVHARRPEAASIMPTIA
jgi:hypothetical protein